MFGSQMMIVLFAAGLLCLTACDAVKDYAQGEAKKAGAAREGAAFKKLAQQRIPDYEAAYERWSNSDDRAAAMTVCQTGNIILDYYRRANAQDEIGTWSDKIAEPCDAAME